MFLRKTFIYLQNQLQLRLNVTDQRQNNTVNYINKGQIGLKPIDLLVGVNVQIGIAEKRLWTLIRLLSLVCGTSSTQPVRLTGCRITLKRCQQK